MLNEYYEFDYSQCSKYSITDITISNLCRPHKYKCIEEAIEEFSYNWECLGLEEFRRGSERLYLVDDQYYIKVSRNGLSMSGNNVTFSKNCPEELEQHICFSIFEDLLEDQFGDIQEGEKEFDNNISIATPRQILLKQECSSEEISKYYDEIADLTYELVNRYHNEVKTVRDLRETIEWYRYNRKNTYRNYIGFTPTVVSKVVNSINLENEWEITGDYESLSEEVPDKIDGAKKVVTLYKEDEKSEQFINHGIEIIEDDPKKGNEISVKSFSKEKGNIERESHEYNTSEELESKITNLMKKY